MDMPQCVRVCVCVRVWKREERGRERTEGAGRERKRERVRERKILWQTFVLTACLSLEVIFTTLLALGVIRIRTVEAFN